MKQSLKKIKAGGFHHSKMIEVNIYNFLPIVNYDNLCYIKEFLNGKINIKAKERRDLKEDWTLR